MDVDKFTCLAAGADADLRELHEPDILLSPLSGLHITYTANAHFELLPTWKCKTSKFILRLSCGIMV